MMTETVVTVDQSHASPGAQQQQQQAKPDSSLNWIKFNLLYFKSIPGILKLVQLLFGIICMACASPALTGGTHWFLFVVVTSFIATVLWSFIYLLGIREVLNLPINWILTELINTGFATFLYLIAFIVQLAVWSKYYGYAVSANIAAGVFGIFNFLAYAAGTYFLYVEHKSSGV
ncbi:CKLF-like MARVEL transmembrane domain-containing protein 4 [Uranotaenia lowii]|uniref:CKLF-like MARVEL transmembrane domain-containing protein 4 n=1 Tax=Uranotaenia lowii TaxID=190385 RepID=UPI002478B5FB|nr:CKLF-like MARVEL transmembrane domain-containing protein 4 [Uranotaenia lowii]XP_055586346.1 CKLF-like MARVEL transmembrane domain-containing protein 4 [Uranotaenia lowii]XP_055586347.1 CKLF-like MARVEL transmembrane domain-containing protein 4 [Uranotaenia lowii]XP_055586348.1 CKLF-like MARVEL transmembrane domain-containing protein 4 [Uranotaenia lowii]XP_055586349.1 CKLF-like MARVEL transmembrane domain-containing protein 4 [Uranotaenia lowii]XP_055586350.1 CKLF-like MARVEL transmembrane